MKPDGDPSHNTSELEKWLCATSGCYIHPALHITATTGSIALQETSTPHDAQQQTTGIHWRAEAQISADTRLISIPHSLALSYLNALVDDAYPVFKQRRHDFTVEAIGFFYLMLQHIHRSQSFWKPYLDTLPFPPDVLTTPFFSQSDEEKQWLIDTDVWHTIVQRRQIYEGYYSKGTAILQSAGVDTSKFSWEYFLWSVTMFTSRSFSSRAIAPHDSKYWTTYKSSAGGNRQTILIDMSHVPAADLDFSVLFPGIDAGNHKDVKVHWDYSPGRFSITTGESFEAGSEVYNNYGPKSNGELLQGYGFCLHENPYDIVLFTLRAPSEAFQSKIRNTHHGYFDSNGQWLPDKATFNLRHLPETTEPYEAFSYLPDGLLDLVTLQLMWTNAPYTHFEDCLTKAHQARDRYSPHVARILCSSVQSKLHRLQSSTPDSSTRSASIRQQYAQVYRLGQMAILHRWHRTLQDYQYSICSHVALARGVPVTPREHVRSRLIVLEDIASNAWLVSTGLWKHFLSGIEAVSNTSDIDQLRLAGWEDDVWVLLFGFLYVSQGRHKGQEAPNEDPLMLLLCEYASLQGPTGQSSEESVDLLNLVSSMAAATSSTIWSSELWSSEVIDSIAGRLVQQEGFQLEHNIGGQPMLVTAICVSDWVSA